MEWSATAHLDSKIGQTVAQILARRPMSRTSAAVASRSARSRAVTNTSAPSRANCSAIALPMPRLAPVTTATFPECAADSAGIIFAMRNASSIQGFLFWRPKPSPHF
jgi:hypothetical protein